MAKRRRKKTRKATRKMGGRMRVMVKAHSRRCPGGRCKTRK